VSVPTALRCFQVAAWVTGVGLLVLAFVAMPMKYVFGSSSLIAIVGPTHGFLYMLYIVFTLLLAERLRWRPLWALVVLLAGTVPVASFVAERKVTQQVRQRVAAR
jgi:integral membrane protein